MSAADAIDLSNPCAHVTSEMKARHVHRPAPGCKECLAIGSGWVHLRVCLDCGHVGCCDSSPNKHATAHYRATKHAVITSGEAGEKWAYCYPDDQFLSAE
ncbi:MAG TPA: UBP-type zinc finger domain-containing protein [Polyangiaceae bacterium]|jgi:uncharacterized UBP type Zn finger protein